MGEVTTGERSVVRSAVLVTGLTVLLSAGFTWAGLPSAVLFASLLAGIAHALTSPTVLELPAVAYRMAQAVIGVTIGAAVSLPALRRMGEDALPIGAVLLATLAISLGAGWALSLRRDVSLVTGVFSLIAGGASGVVAIARDLGADDRVVTVVQYLRVLVVLMTMPLVAALVFHPPSGRGGLSPVDAGLSRDLAFTVIAVAVGLALARLVPAPTATLLLPLAVAVGLSVSGWLGRPQVPTFVEWVAFALIGVQVGLRFTRASLASIARLLPTALALIVAVIVLTAVTGALLAWLTPVDGLSAYLATTPGGLFAVLSTAADTGSDVTYVLAVQLCRLLVILALTPALARWLAQRPG